MKTLRRPLIVALSLVYVLTFSAIGYPSFGQSQTMSSPASSGVPGRPVTVPLTIRVKEARREPEELQNIDLTISEDGEPSDSTFNSCHGYKFTDHLALLIQDDVVP